MPDPHAEARDTLADRAAAVRKQHAAYVRRERRSSRAKTLAVIGLGAGLAWAVWNNNQLAAKALGKDVVYAVVQPDGEMVSSVHFTELPPSAKQFDGVQMSLWQYVMARDCYNGPDFPRKQYIAQAMSEYRVGEQVHRQFSASNPDSPQHQYGEKGISVQCELVDPPAPLGATNDILFFRFRRWLDNSRVTPAEIAAAPIYFVAVRYRTGVYPADPRRGWVDRSTFNPAGVQVLDYPGAQPENVRPAIRVSQTAGVNR